MKINLSRKFSFKLVFTLAVLLSGSCAHYGHGLSHRIARKSPAIIYTNTPLDIIGFLEAEIPDKHQEAPVIYLPEDNIEFGKSNEINRYLFAKGTNQYIKGFHKLNSDNLEYYFSFSQPTREESKEFLSAFHSLSSIGVLPVKFSIDEIEIQYLEYLKDFFNIDKTPALIGYRGFLQTKTFKLSDIEKDQYYVFGGIYTHYILKSGDTQLNLNIRGRVPKNLRVGMEITVYYFSEVPSDMNGMLLAPPGPELVPLALMFGERLIFIYTNYHLDLPPGAGRAVVPAPFSTHRQRIAIFRNPQYSIAEVQNVLKVFEKHVVSSIAESKLNAEKYNENISVKGRVRFTSINNRSEVLRGARGPYFESSSYTLTIYSLDENDLYDPVMVLASRGAEFNYGRMIHIEIDYMNLVSVGMNERFYAASDEQRRLYLEEIQKTVARALQLTAEEIGVEIQNNTLVIP